MSDLDLRPEGLQLYDEIRAVNTVIRRGANLGTAALARVAAGERADVPTVVSTGRWFLEYVHQHHQNEEKLIWPVLASDFPDRAPQLRALADEHRSLARGFDVLSECLRILHGVGRANGGVSPGPAARTALAVADDLTVRLLQQIADEEPVLADLLPRIGPEQARRIRDEMADRAPRGRPELVFGLLEDPERSAGYDAMMTRFPVTIRRMRPLMLGKYRRRVGRLGV